MKIKKACTSDSGKLNKLTLESKAFWGYSREQIDSWREDLKLHPDDILKNNTYLCKIDASIIGYTTFIFKDDQRVYLKNLFIDPKYIHQGYGGKLLSFVIGEVSKKGFQEIYLESDPHAEAFYKKYGFITYDTKESSIDGKPLPLMSKKLARNGL